ncbi:hypothetical protein ABID19_005670 [Mesorhizobium robiniae]|uniref:DUF3597 domain-containing protein n=1 Tax=Mesorhizobium robiniae TaxID=559315 RepID=A0ABV2GWD2_9HYPH
MGIFDKIKGAIFGSAVAAELPAAAPASPSASITAPEVTPTVITGSGPVVDTTAAAAPSAPGASSTAPDVAAILNKAVAAKGQKLNWKSSIVDLMKALDIDSSLAARKELARDLNYTGDMSDSATMNVWLHGALMKKLAENGGKIPSDLAA